MIASIVYLYNRYKRITIKKVYKSYSNDITHYMSEEDLDSSYGRAEILLQMKNDSKFNKSIELKELEYKVTNYEEIEFNNIILDYDIKSFKQIIGGTYGEINQFLLFAINNSFNESKDIVFIKYYGDGINISNYLKTEINLKLKPGEINQILKVDFLDSKLINLFKENEWNELKIIILFKENRHTISVKFINGAFQFKMGQFGAGGPPTKDNVQDLLITNNGSDYNTRIIKVQGNSQEHFILKLFTPRASRFNFTIFHKGSIIYEDNIVINVPIYNVRHLTNNILYFNQFSKFMIENNIEVFNLDDKLYDTSKLDFYDYKSYFSKTM